MRGDGTDCYVRMADGVPRARRWRSWCAVIQETKVETLSMFCPDRSAGLKGAPAFCEARRNFSVTSEQSPRHGVLCAYIPLASSLSSRIAEVKLSHNMVLDTPHLGSTMSDFVRKSCTAREPHKGADHVDVDDTKSILACTKFLILTYCSQFS